MEETGFPRDMEEVGGSAVGLLVYKVLGGFCSRTGGKATDCSRLLHSFCPYCLPLLPFSRVAQLSLFWRLDGFWGFLVKVAGSKD